MVQAHEEGRHVTLPHPRKRMQTALRGRIPASVVQGDSQLAARFKEAAALVQKYLSGRGRFPDAVQATAFIESCSDGSSRDAA